VARATAEHQNEVPAPHPPPHLMMIPGPRLLSLCSPLRPPNRQGWGEGGGGDPPCPSPWLLKAPVPAQCLFCTDCCPLVPCSCALVVFPGRPLHPPSPHVPKLCCCPSFYAPALLVLLRCCAAVLCFGVPRTPPSPSQPACSATSSTHQSTSPGCPYSARCWRSLLQTSGLGSQVSTAPGLWTSGVLPLDWSTLRLGSQVSVQSRGKGGANVVLLWLWRLFFLFWLPLLPCPLLPALHKVLPLHCPKLVSLCRTGSFLGPAVCRVLDIKSKEECVVVGTLYKSMLLKPSILDEYSTEVQPDPTVKYHYHPSTPAPPAPQHPSTPAPQHPSTPAPQHPSTVPSSTVQYHSGYGSGQSMQLKPSILDEYSTEVRRVSPYMCLCDPLCGPPCVHAILHATLCATPCATPVSLISVFPEARWSPRAPPQLRER